MTRFSFVLLLAVLFLGCASVDVTKTAKGHFDATNANDVEILMTRPEKPFLELGTVSASGYQLSETAKMHNAIRTEAAGLGANAVVILNEGLLPDGWGGGNRWCTGVAIRFK